MEQTQNYSSSNYFIIWILNGGNSRGGEETRGSTKYSIRWPNDQKNWSKTKQASAEGVHVDISPKDSNCQSSVGWFKPDPITL